MKILSALLLVALSLGMTEQAAAEVPVAGRLQDSSPPKGQSPHKKNHKHFMHHRGPNALHQSKRDGVALLLRKRAQRQVETSTLLASTVLPPVPKSPASMASTRTRRSPTRPTAPSPSDRRTSSRR